ncbi:MAG TPA: Na+/H+ antiporter subunit E [Bryobacteraceae bacterium]|nr:Na+/H+ antiporter subunit E [Bryobacteraceae bacterium]HOQ46974.1 Na+/H+ antiporter subunit E [Bryobacteraceae bacterium]HPU73099.1 Na+/H+ antiporter subunit E [Bryobacteraceae bacterium]
MKRVLLRLAYLLEFIGFFHWQLVLANLRLAREVLGPVSRLHPGVVAIPLELTGDGEVTVLSNIVTLTPGTLSLDVSSDDKVLYVHVANISDVEDVRRDIKEGFERRIRRVFG